MTSGACAEAGATGATGFGRAIWLAARGEGFFAAGAALAGAAFAAAFFRAGAFFLATAFLATFALLAFLAGRRDFFFFATLLFAAARFVLA